MADAPQAPERESKVADIAELIKRLCVAVTNVEMFSADHPMARKSIEHAYEWLKGLFDRRAEAVVISVAGKRIVLDGLPLEERNPLVSKLAAKLDEVHINNLFFQPETSQEEFQNFYRVLGKGPKAINAGPGFAAMLEELGVQNIQLRDISYVMVTGDQKVVSRDAKVVEGEKGSSADSEMVKYMIWKVLQKADEQKWLINEIKNNPQKMADMILDGLELAISRSEIGIKDEEGSIEALLGNIRKIGEGLVERSGDDTSPGESDDAGRALMTLENEIRLRSSKLMSSKVASGFINEILHVVTGYADRARAKEVTDEFLKGEDGLKRAEKLLRDMAPKTESAERYIARIRGQLQQRGLSEEDLQKLLSGLEAGKQVGAEPAAEGAADKPKKPRKPRAKKPVSQAVAEGLGKRLKDLHVADDQARQMTESLGSFIEDRARERAGEIREEAEHFRGEAERRGRLLEDLPMGVVIWDGEGRVEFVNAAATAAAGLGSGSVLTEPVRAALSTWPFPLDQLPELPADTALTEEDMKLLTSVARVVKDAAGDAYALILLPARGRE